MSLDVDVRVVDIELPLDVSENPAVQRKGLAGEIGVGVDRIGGIRLLKHSIDARQKQLKVRLRFEVAIGGGCSTRPARVKETPHSPARASERSTIRGTDPQGG